VQVAVPAEFTVTLGQSLLELPLMEKLIVPEGFTGVSATPVSWAVKVTEVPRATDDDGVGVKVIEATSAVTVWVVFPVLVAKFVSPEYTAAIF